MDPRLYMLAGTFALLVIALVAITVSAVRKSRRRHHDPDEVPSVPIESPALPPDLDQPVETSLDEPELDVPADSPSTALLTPLRIGEWCPPEEPAPAASLPEASLYARVASFETETGIAAPTTPEPRPEPAPAVAPVTVAPPVIVPRIAPKNFIIPGVRPEPVSATQAASTPPGPTFAPVPTDETPEPTPDQSALLERLGSSALSTESPAPVAPQPVGEAVADAVPPSTPESQYETHAEAPVVAEPILPPLLSPQPEQRPRTVVRSIDAARPGPGSSPALEPLAPTAPTTAGATGRSDIEDVVLAAPVEMWFDDARIGVKAGTKTYAQFRKYADVLFGDLKAAKTRNR